MYPSADSGHQHVHSVCQLAISSSVLIGQSCGFTLCLFISQFSLCLSSAAVSVELLKLLLCVLTIRC